MHSITGFSCVYTIIELHKYHPSLYKLTRRRGNSTGSGRRRGVPGSTRRGSGKRSWLRDLLGRRQIYASAGSEDDLGPTAASGGLSPSRAVVGVVVS